MGQCSTCSGSEPIQPTTPKAAAWPDEQFEADNTAPTPQNPRPSYSHPKRKFSTTHAAPAIAPETTTDSAQVSTGSTTGVVDIDAYLTPLDSPASNKDSVDTLIGKCLEMNSDSVSSSKSASLKAICSSMRRNWNASARSEETCVTAEEVMATALKMAQHVMRHQAESGGHQQKMVLDLILYLQLPRKLISVTTRSNRMHNEAANKLEQMDNSDVSSWISGMTMNGQRRRNDDFEMQRQMTMSGDDNFSKLERRLTMLSDPEMNRRPSGTKPSAFLRSLSGVVHTTVEGVSKMMQGISSLSANLRSARLFRMIHTNKELHECLDKISRWEFNAFDVLHFTKRPLTVVSLYAMNLFDLFNKFHIRLTVWLSFIEKIESAYKDNPYHNSTHAADVLAAEVFWLTQSENVVCKFEPIDFLTCIIGACIHDVGHPGTTSDFEIRAGSDIAIQYNDTSVLENYHLSVTFNILKRSRYNIFALFSEQIRNDIRKALIEMVLTTDVSKHLEHVALVKDYLLQKEILSQLNQRGPNNIQHINQREPKCRVSVTEENEIDTSHFMTRSEVRALLRNISLKVSDLSNPTRPLNIALLWTERIITEFHQQGDKERALGLSVTPMMDRTKANIELSQLAFIDHIIIPLYESWFQMVKVTMIPIQNLIITRNYWIIKAEEQTGVEQTVLRKKNAQLHKLLSKSYSG